MRLTISKKLIIGFLSMAVLLGIISTIAYSQLQKVNDSYSDLVNRRAVILANAKDIQNAASREISTLRSILLRESGGAVTLTSSYRELKKSIAATSSLIVRTEVKDQLKKINTLNEQFKINADLVSALMRSGELERAMEMAAEKVMPLAKEIRDIADKIAADQAKNMSQGTTDTSAVVTKVKTTLVVVSVVSIILAALIGVVISRLISRPLIALAKGAERIADGELNHEDISVKNQDEIGDLASSFNRMKHNLRNLISQVGFNTDQVAATAEELAANAEQTGRATEQITISMQEAAAGAERQVTGAQAANETVGEISQGMNQAELSIRSVTNLTLEANEQASQGNNVVTEAIQQMNRVQQSVGESAQVVEALSMKSKDIGKIVQWITEIASQTNLLALNASIEAARAGEQGRGFAVVAAEVRKLAEQTGEAANQVRDLIVEIQAESMKAVQSINEGAEVFQEGIRQVDRTGEVFEEILSSIQQVSSEAREVSAIIEQVNAGANRMVETMENIALIAEQSSANTQNVAASAEEQNASMEEVASSSEALSKMAQELQTLISKFKV